MENHASVLGIAARKSNLFSRFKSGGCYRSYVDFICLRHIEKERVRIAIRCARNYIRADLCVLFRFDTVAWICGGQGTILARIIYTLVALAGIWCISLLFRDSDDARTERA